MMKKLLQGAVVVAALIGAAAIWWALAATEGPRRESAGQASGVLVRTEAVQRYGQRPVIDAGGTVRARRVLALRPQVSGEIVWLSPRLIAGGRLEKGEEIVRLDSRDYRNGLEKARAGLAAARARLALEKGRGDIAREEWRYFQRRHPDSGEGKRSLALRQPQLDAVEAEIAERRASVAQARLRLERTTLQAPFDALVLEQQAAMGAVAGPQTMLAQLVRSDVFDVEVKLPLDALPFIARPAEGGKPPAAEVVMQAGGRSYSYEGVVSERVPAVEPRGRMARLIVAVEEPLRQNAAQPLLLGTFVEVRIESRLAGDAIAVPRSAVHYGDRIYLYEEGKLRIARPEVIWRLPGHILVEEGVEPGDEVIVSPLAAPVEGMLLRREKADDAGERQS